MSAPFEDYLAIQAVNWSSLKHMHESPHAYNYWQQHPRGDTPAYLKGRAVHCAVLEPDDFEDRFKVVNVTLKDGWDIIGRMDVEGVMSRDYAVFTGSPQSRNGKDYKQFKKDHGDDPRPILLQDEVDTYAGLWERYGDSELLTPAVYDEVRLISDAVHRCPEAMELINGGPREINMEWTWPGTDVACKGRADVLPGRVIDVKTAENVTDRGFSTAAAKYLYHGQGGFYNIGAKLCGYIPQDAPPPGFITAQSKAPYDVVVREMDEDETRAGEDFAQMLMCGDKDGSKPGLIQCKAAGQWPGISGGKILPLYLPDYAPGMKSEDKGSDGMDWGA